MAQCLVWLNSVLSVSCPDMFFQGHLSKQQRRRSRHIVIEEVHHHLIQVCMTVITTPENIDKSTKLSRLNYIQ